LLGGKNVGRSGSDWRPVSNGFTNLTSGRSTGGGSSSVEGGVSASPSENGITLTLSAARGEGVGAVETLSALPSFMPLPVSVITNPSAGISTPGAAKAVRVLPIPRIMLRVYNGAMSLAYNTVPGHAFSTQVSYSAVSGLVKTQAVQVETRTPVFTKPTTSSLPAFTGLTFTQATAAMPKAEAERFSYLQTAGQAFPALTYSLSAPSSFSGGREAPSSPVSSLPLWVFPLSAIMPLLAMGLLVRQD
jgi:hypothetical protein